MPCMAITGLNKNGLTLEFNYAPTQLLGAEGASAQLGGEGAKGGGLRACALLPHLAGE